MCDSVDCDGESDVGSAIGSNGGVCWFVGDDDDDGDGGDA